MVLHDGVSPFRDGSDLVVSGSQDKLPVTVRFSYDENTPGLNIRMSVPANFTLTISPKGAQAPGEGKTLVRTGDDMFDARFVTKTDHMAQAKMFVGGKQALSLLQKLCCSSKTFVHEPPSWSSGSAQSKPGSLGVCRRTLSFVSLPGQP